MGHIGATGTCLRRVRALSRVGVPIATGERRSGIRLHRAGRRAVPRPRHQQTNLLRPEEEPYAEMGIVEMRRLRQFEDENLGVESLLRTSPWTSIRSSR